MSSIKKVISNWDGATVASANLLAHASSSQHHVTVSTSSPGATGILRLRMVPTGMTTPVASGMEAIDIALAGGARSFVVNGFYSSIVAQFTTALAGGTATIAVASTGEHLAALPGSTPSPPTTIIASAWDGVGIAGKSAPSHGEIAVHHIAVACSTVPSAGTLTIQARATGTVGRVNIGGPFNLVTTGTVNIIVVGFYDEFYLVAGNTIVGAGMITARVASAGIDLNAWLVGAGNIIIAAAGGGIAITVLERTVRHARLSRFSL